MRLLVLVISLAAFLVTAGLVSRIWRPKPAIQPADRFWSTVFRPDQRTVFVPGDSGLVMFENLTHHESDLGAYSSGQYLDWANQASETNPDRAKNLGLRRYAAVADVQLAARLAGTNPWRASPLRIRYARDITPEDLKTGNIVLSGDPQGNPWVELFAPRLNFRFTMDPTAAIHIVRNVAPRAGELAEYRSFGGDPEHHAYALIALTRNLNRNGYVMLIEGTTVAGLDAASDFLFSSTDFSPAILPALRPDGSFADFEILLETQNIAARSSGVKVIATRYA